ncbi:MAG: DegT/DnrJ/EryC1/StrS family aminotransferase [Myxococcota bacterium]|nr:DegT/DnrJ/EryC1/StrS family aminotransferase [Myxococcota bacterium]
MPVSLFDLVRLHAPLRAEIMAVLEGCLDSGRFIQGPAVEKLEAQLATTCGTPFAVGVSSGTDALLAAFMALEVKPGDEIITSTYTFFATAGSIARLGARPVFVDVLDDSFNIDPQAIEAAITPRTVGIVPVHLFGQCADMDAVLEIARRRGLWVVEDAAQSIGAEDRGRRAGSMGAMGILSFFPAKNLGALGDAGAVVTGDAALAGRLKVLREHGSVQRYAHEILGANFRIDALQAGFLSVKLPYLRGWEEGRRRNAAFYHEHLGRLSSLRLPWEAPNKRHVFNQFAVRTPRRDALRATLEARKIGCAVYYPTPLHLQPCFGELGGKPGDCPVAEGMSKDSLALPMDPLLTQDQLALVVSAVQEEMAH